MTRKQAERMRRRDERLESWSRDGAISLAQLDEGQRWVAYATLRAADAIGEVKPLRRALTYFLAKTDMGLTEPVIGALTGVSDRTVRSTKVFGPKELVTSIAQIERGHRQPKLKAAHAGVVARLLVEHPGASVSQLLSLVQKELGISVERHAFARYIERYGLGLLRQETVINHPLFGDTPIMVERSS